MSFCLQNSTYSASDVKTTGKTESPIYCRERIVFRLIRRFSLVYPITDTNSKRTYRRASQCCGDTQIIVIVTTHQSTSPKQLRNIGRYRSHALLINSPQLEIDKLGGYSNQSTRTIGAPTKIKIMKETMAATRLSLIRIPVKDNLLNPLKSEKTTPFRSCKLKEQTHSRLYAVITQFSHVVFNPLDKLCALVPAVIKRRSSFP